ncbi:MAG: potassium channel protein [Desulfobacteraceae bacterium]|nr:potassium channel protein [Desulfobacteraceae bacterium]
MLNHLRKRNYLAGLALLAVTAIGTSGYYLLGWMAAGRPQWPVADCFYMTMITLTTVGFGEVIDLAAVPGARMFTIFILLSGLGVAAYFVSNLTAFLVEGELTNVFWRKKMDKRIRGLANHIIVCGVGRVGFYIIQELHRARMDFIAIDTDEQRLKAVQAHLGEFPAVVGDATHARFLQAAGLERARGVISALSDDKDNLCVVVTCRQLKPGVHLISSCKEAEFAGKLELIGAEVVTPNSIGGMRIASQMIRPRVVHYLDLMLRDSNCVVRIEDLPVPAGSALAGKPLDRIDFGELKKLLILAVIREGLPEPIYNPERSMVLQEGDTLVVQADVDTLARFRRGHGC